MVWKSTIPARVSFFLWEVTREAINTTIKLHRIFSDRPGTGIMCGTNDETIEHFLLECNEASYMWRTICDGFNALVPQQTNLRGWMIVPEQKNWHNKRTDWLWRIFLHAIAWVLWEGMNARFSRDQKRERSGILDEVLM